MTPSLTKTVAELIVSVMTFLGWNTSEYSYLLPPPIQQHIGIVAEKNLEDQRSETGQPKISNSKDLNVEQKTSPVAEQKAKTETPPPTKKQIVKVPVKATTPKTNTPTQKPKAPVIPKTKTTVVLVTEDKPAKQIETEKKQVYYPAPVETIKKEIQNIVNQIDPPKTETEIKKETANLSVEEKIKKSVVNIYCSRVIGNRIQKTTGSGVVVDSSGVIITNAHVAEYFLLAQNGNNTNCYIRTGSPAVSSYKAKLVYLPSEWVNANKNNLSLSTLTGTGENDYALLVVTERIRNDAPNIPLTFLNPTNNQPTQNQNIFAAGYPAGFSDVKILDSALYELTKSTSITRLSSFTGDTVDVINTGPTSVAEHGSSGGAIVDEESNLVALIVATTIDSQTGGKNIQAITLPYIKRSIKNSSGKSFDSLISNARDEAINFEKTTLPILTNTLLGN